MKSREWQWKEPREVRTISIEKAIRFQSDKSMLEVEAQIKHEHSDKSMENAGKYGHNDVEGCS